MINAKILVLDGYYQLHKIITAKNYFQKSRAIGGYGIDVLEWSDNYAYSAQNKYKIPSVIKLNYFPKNSFRNNQFRNYKNKLKLYLRDGAKCYYCQHPITYKEATRDHIYPQSKGGITDPSNLIIACKFCNQAKNDALPEKSPAQARVNLDKFLLRLEVQKNAKPEWIKYIC